MFIDYLLSVFIFTIINTLGLEAATGGVIQEKVFLEISRKHLKTPVPESPF